MSKTLLVAGLLVVALLAAVPPASASDLCQIFKDPPKACYTAQSVAFAALDYALCFYNTAPSQWASCV